MHRARRRFISICLLLFAGLGTVVLPTGVQAAATVKTTTTMAALPSPAQVDQSVALSATVQGKSPSGTITFQSGTTVLGTANLVAQKDGVTAVTAKSISTVFSAAGVVGLTATYSGDANNLASTSAALSLTVAKVPSTVSLTAAPNPLVVGQSTTLTAKVSGVNPSGSVTFLNGTTNLGSAPISAGVATLAVPFTTVGIDALGASYAGDGNNSPSTALPVPLVVAISVSTIALAISPSPAFIAQPVNLVAKVGGYSPTGTVNFFNGLSLLGSATLSGGSASLVVEFNSAATETITALYLGDSRNLPSVTLPAAFPVKPLVKTTTTLSASSNPAIIGQAETLTATVAPTTSGAATPTGTVTFFDGTSTLGTTALSGGKASLATTFTALGSHGLTVVYAGDYGSASSTSLATAISVGASPTVTTLVPAPNPATVGQAVSLTATVGGYLPTGTIGFTDGATSLGTASLSSGQATLSATFATSGVHSLKASYAGDANNTASTSTVFSLTVNPNAAPPPLVVNPTPAAGTILAANALPVISANFQDQGGGVNPASAKILVDGVDVTAGAVVSASGFSYTPTTPLAEGTHAIAVSVSGSNTTAGSLTWNFITRTPPSFGTTAPRNISTLSAQPQIVVTYSDVGAGIDPASFKILLNGTDMTSLAAVTATGAVLTPSNALTPGTQTVSVSVADKAGNVSTSQWSFVVMVLTTPATLPFTPGTSATPTLVITLPIAK